MVQMKKVQTMILRESDSRQTDRQRDNRLYNSEQGGVDDTTKSRVTLPGPVVNNVLTSSLGEVSRAVLVVPPSHFCVKKP